LFLLVLPLLIFLKSPDHDEKSPSGAPAPKIDVHVEV
jgi:hypothetical protein